MIKLNVYSFMNEMNKLNLSVFFVYMIWTNIKWNVWNERLFLFCVQLITEVNTYNTKFMREPQSQPYTSSIYIARLTHTPKEGVMYLNKIPLQSLSTIHLRFVSQRLLVKWVFRDEYFPFSIVSNVFQWFCVRGNRACSKFIPVNFIENLFFQNNL